jgi:hypothetical protein
MGFCLTCDMWHLFPGSYLSGVLANTPWLCPQIHKDPDLERKTAQIQYECQWQDSQGCSPISVLGSMAWLSLISTKICLLCAFTFSSLNNKDLEVGWAEPNAGRKGITKEDCHQRLSPLSFILFAAGDHYHLKAFFSSRDVQGSHSCVWITMKNVVFHLKSSIVLSLNAVSKLHRQSL